MGVRVEGLQATIEFVSEFPKEIVTGTAFEFASRCRRRTPVDTGYAMNSWIVTLDRNDFGTPGSNIVDARIGQVESMRLGQTVYVNNGANYIGPLERGHSRQAPGGMVAVTVPEVPDIVQAQVADLKGAQGR